MPDKQRRVLVLEDDADLRTMICEVFTSLGARECTPLGSLASLQETPRALETDLAIIDVNLGEGRPNGVDACRWLRRNGYTGKIVFLTGHAQSYPPVATAQQQDAAQVLQKPTSIDDLERVFAG